MNLNRSRKSEEKKQLEELYPKVKTFSKAYDFSPSKQEPPADPAGYEMPFRQDERPYPAVPVPAAAPEIATDPDDFNDPERIDLQDTLLTDESFTERIPKHHPSADKANAADKSVRPVASDAYEASEPAAEDGPGPFFASDPEAEYETDSFYDPEHDAEDASDSCTVIESDTEEESASFYMPDFDTEDEPEPLPASMSGDKEEPDPVLGTEPETVEQLFPKLESKGKTSLTATWQPVTDADGYDVFFATGGEPFGGVYRTLSPEETACTFTQLNKKTVYKMYVSAFMMTGGQKAVVCESEPVRCITGGSTKKHTNAQEIRTKESGIDLTVGEKKKISTSVTGQDPDKQVLAHDGLLRYLSEDTSVATVSKEGKVRGVAPGNCRIYLIAANGLRSAVDVSVQEDAASVAFRKKKYAVKVGKTINLKKKLESKPDKGSGSLKWKSSDKRIAEVSRKGIVTALKKGQITVRVKAGKGSRAKVRIRVSTAKKPAEFPWESVGFGKKSAAGRK